MVYYELGKYNEAISALKKAVSINPGNGDTRAFLGFLYDLVGDGENALLSLSQLDVYRQELEAKIMLLPQIYLSLVFKGQHILIVFLLSN